MQVSQTFQDLVAKHIDFEETLLMIFAFTNSIVFIFYFRSWNLNKINFLRHKSSHIIKINHLMSVLMSITLFLINMNNVVVLIVINGFNVNRKMLITNWAIVQSIMALIIHFQNTVFPNIFAVSTFLLAIQKCVTLKYPNFRPFVRFRSRCLAFIIINSSIISLMYKIAIPIICKWERYDNNILCVLKKIDISSMVSYFLSCASISVNGYLILFVNDLPGKKYSSVSKTNILQTILYFVFQSVLIVIKTRMGGGPAIFQNSLACTIMELEFLALIINLPFIIFNFGK